MCWSQTHSLPWNNKAVRDPFIPSIFTVMHFLCSCLFHHYCYLLYSTVVHWTTNPWSFYPLHRGRNSSVGSAWACCHSVAGSILLWGHFPVEGIFPLELTWVQTPFLQNSFGWEYKPRSSLCTHAFHRTDSKDPDVHVLDGWMPATKTHPARTTHEDGMWLP